MSECQCPKVKGAICNVTINADDIWKILSRGMDNNGVVQVCFQRKLNFKSHVFFEAVRPTVLQRFLYFLKNITCYIMTLILNLTIYRGNWSIL